jgi:methionine-rich copper-binding protein CopC
VIVRQQFVALTMRWTLEYVGPTCASLTAAPALAHTKLEDSTPAQGASLASASTAVSLTFGEA